MERFENESELKSTSKSLLGWRIFLFILAGLVFVIAIFAAGYTNGASLIGWAVSLFLVIFGVKLGYHGKTGMVLAEISKTLKRQEALEHVLRREYIINEIKKRGKSALWDYSEILTKQEFDSIESEIDNKKEEKKNSSELDEYLKSGAITQSEYEEIKREEKV